MANTERGKPAATNTRRQVVAAMAGHKDSSAAMAVGKSATLHSGACACCKLHAKPQAAAQVSKAGKGQGKLNTRVNL